MRNKRKIAAFVIILAGIGASVLIISFRVDKTDERGISATVASMNDNPSFQFKSNTFKPKTTTAPTTSEPDERSSDNLTELLTQSFTNSLLESEEGSSLSEEGVTQALREVTAHPLDYPQFTIKDIVISSNNSIENQIAYIESVDTLLWKHFGEFENENTLSALNTFFKDTNPRLIERLINVIPAYLDDLLRLKTPDLCKELHIQILNLWQEKLVIYQAVVNFKSDPLKAYVSLQQLPITIQKEQDIQSLIKQFYKELTA